jgi:zinc finger protein
MATDNQSPTLFQTVGEQVEDSQKVVEEIESLCMNCHADGTTRLLLTRIPFFREVVLMSFACPECGFRNSEIQPAGEIQPQGHKYAFRLDNEKDLSRQVVKSDSCVFRVEELDLEVPAGRGRLTNIEGLVSAIKGDLEEKQDERRRVQPDIAEKVQAVIDGLAAMLDGSRFPFTVSVDDPAGNSWIEPLPSDANGKYTRKDYTRTPEQNAELGLGGGEEEEEREANGDGAPPTTIREEYHPSHMVPALPPQMANLNVDESEDIIENQVYTFPSTCPACTHACECNMKMVNIPHFKQVIIMSIVCDTCGYRSNEVKTGGEVSERGRRITLKVEKPEDLSRDILKAESCHMSCPEITLSVEPGTLGGRFTTVEGLLVQVRTDLRQSIYDTDDGGDSKPEEEKAQWEAFFSKLDKAIKGEIQFTIVLQDPLASSYIQSLADVDGELDDQLKVEDYDRTDEEEEELGLKDIKTEGYANDEPGSAEPQPEADAPAPDDSELNAN